MPLVAAAEVALGRQRAPQYEVGKNLMPYLRSANIVDGALDLSDVKSMNFTPAEQRIFLLRYGDVLMTEGSGSQNAVGASAVWRNELGIPICFQNTLLRLRPRAGVSDGRFLYWWARHAHASGQIAAVASGANIKHLGAESLRRLPVHLPPLDEQRRIAAFLDDQVVRIDQAIALTHSQQELFASRDLALLDGLMGRHGLRLPDQLDDDWTSGLPAGWRVIHFSQVLKQLTNGYVGPTRDILQDDGIRYIQSVHIKNGTIDFERRPFYVSTQWHRERPRISLRAEDVLIVQTGAIGQVAVVPADFGPASCHALLIARVQPSIVSGRYIAAYLRSPLGFQSLLSRATGALHPHLEGGIKDVKVIVPPIDVQDVICVELDELRHANDVVALGLDRRASLLQERKRSLITTAVTGEFDVSSASTRALAGATS